MSRTMYDSVNVSGIPASASLVAGYVDGHYANFSLMRSRFPHAGVVGIAVSPHTDAGIVIDVEKGDATPAGAVSWVLMRRRAGADPTVYCNQSAWSQVRSAFQSAGVAEPHYWIAKWDGIASLLPNTVAKQYQNHPSYDVSVVADYWPGVDPRVTTPVKPPQHISAYYTVQHDDTLSGIAARYHISLAQIEHLNPQITNPDLIYPGEKVKVSAPTTNGSAVYVVKPNDTLSGIANAHGLTLSQIEARNPQIKKPNLIYPGDKVFV